MAFRWPLSILLGTAAMALSAQFAVPLPFSPVPMSLQGLAVLLVGGLLGAACGTASLILYLALGAFGAPVFANGTGGLAKLIGPTGGYLLAFPVAAAAVGAVAKRGSLGRCLLASLLGMTIIHAGGLAQLTLISGSWRHAAALGTAPFLVADLLKVVLATMVLWAGHHALRPRA
jgi:biotin transport system substrate-specific component